MTKRHIICCYCALDSRRCPICICYWSDGSVSMSML